MNYTTITGQSTSAWGEAALDGELAKLTDRSLDNPSAALRSAAYKLGQIAPTGHVNEREIVNQLCAVGRTLDLQERDVRSLVASGFEDGKRAPREPSTAREIQDATDVFLGRLAWWQVAGNDPAYHDRKGATTLRILAALYLVSVMVGRLEFYASLRQLAELSGLTVGTVCKHQDRVLRHATRLQRGDRRGTHGTRWRLQPPTEDETTLWLSEPMRGTLTDPGNDRYYLWGNGFRIYCALSWWHPRTPRQLAEGLGLHRSTIYRALHRFEVWGIATRREDGRWTSVGARSDPERFERRRELRERHEAERDIYTRPARERASELAGGRTVDIYTGEIVTDPEAVA